MYIVSRAVLVVRWLSDLAVGKVRDMDLDPVFLSLIHIWLVS